MFSKRRFGIGFIVGAGLIVAVTYGVVSADHAWRNYHWDGSGTSVSLSLGDNFSTTAWNTSYANAVVDWDMSTVLSLTKFGGGRTTPSQCTADNGNIEVCAAKYGTNGWLGLAQIWTRGPHIRKAIAKMNDSYFTGGFYDHPEWRATVMCQEIGHDFGLGHQDENFNNTNLYSCMDYTSDPSTNQHPNEHDYYQLELMYAHLDGGGGGGGGDTKPCKGPAWKCAEAQPPPPAFDMELPNRGQWGREIAVSRDGGQSVFVQNFGNGYRVYTHVTWTLEVAETLRR